MWKHLAQSAFDLHETLRGAGTHELRVQLARKMIDSALEAFPSGLDPVDEFEAFSARRMLLALKEALEPIEPRGR